MAFSYLWLIVLYLLRVQSEDAPEPQHDVTTDILLHAGTQDFKHEIRDDQRDDNEVKWEYGTMWCEKYSRCCSGKQSPIALHSKSATSKQFDAFKFESYDAASKEFRLANTGRTVSLTLEYEDQKPTVSGGGLTGTYEFAFSHFHWGKDDDVGCEHRVDGQCHPLELQITHVNKKYKVAEQAAEHSNGFAIFAILFEIGQPNEGLNKTFESLSRVKYRDQSVTEDKASLKLKDLLPSSTDKFFRYNGSFTNPMCYEAVTWTVFTKTAQISFDQLWLFRKLYSTYEDDPKPQKLVDNFRPSQPPNRRSVYLADSSGSGFIANQFSIWMMLSAGLTISYLR